MAKGYILNIKKQRSCTNLMMLAPKKENKKYPQTEEHDTLL